MAVAEIEPAGAVVITGRIIDDAAAGRHAWVKPIHQHQITAVVDAIFALVEQQKNPTGADGRKVRSLLKDLETSSVFGGYTRARVVISDPIVH